MPRAKKKGEASQKAAEFLKVERFEVTGARELTFEGKSTCMADVTINGIKIYGCKAITYTDKEGKDHDFVSFPQRKGKDKDGNDKWYSVVYVPLSQEDSQHIAQAIYDAIDKK